MRYSLNRACVRWLVLLICLLGAAHTSLASTFVYPPDDDLIIGARAIVRGKVLFVRCGFNDDQSRIFTYITLRVREVIKGQITNRNITLKEPGGQVENQGSVIFGTPQFKPDEEVLLYLDTWNDGSLRVHQMFLGKFSVIVDPKTGERIAVREGPDRNTVVVDREAHAERFRGAITNRSELTAYTEMVRRRLATNLERSQKFEETYYRNVSLLARPPEYDGKASRAFQPMFTFLSAPPARWFEPDDGLPVAFTINPDGAPNPQIIDDLTAAMNAWSTVAGCALRVVVGGTGEICYARDSNTMVFNNCDSQFSPSPFCSGILALGGLSWNAGERKTINGVSFVRAHTGHISFNPYASCEYTDHCKVREIATHELGHALGLGHSWNFCSSCPQATAEQLDATMFGVAHFDGRCASLRQDDVNGIVFMYPAVGGGPGPLTVISSSPLLVGTVGSAYSQSLIAIGGTTPYTWSLVARSLPAGLTINSSGIISGTPTATGISDFTVQVTDAGGVTAQKALSITVTTGSVGYDSQFVSQNVPTTLQPNQAFTINVKWLNTGTKSWDAENAVSLRSQNPADNATWGGNQVPLLFSSTSSGQQLDLVFMAFAPRASGTYNFQWQLYQQEIGFFGQKSVNVSIVVGDGGTPAPEITSGATMEAVKGLAFSFPLAAVGGTPPLTWSIASGTIPAGLNLNLSSGLLAGTPTAEGVASITVQVTDAESRTAQKAMTITVLPPPVEVVTSSLPVAQQGNSFSYQLSAIGGKPPYTWAMTAGALPAGLSFASSTGMITGVPTAAGSFGFTVDVRDAESRTARKSLSIRVTPPPLLIQAVPSLEALKDSSFNYQLVAAGGAPPYTWQITAGTLPAGLTLNPSTGLISGISSVGGTFVVGIAIRDQLTASASTSIQIKVIDPATLPLIKKVKFKSSKKKLTVTVERADRAAVLMINGTQMTVSLTDGQFVLKRLALSSGRHEIKVVNPNGSASLPYILNID